MTAELFVSVDVETTGSIPRLHDLISLGAAAFVWDGHVARWKEMTSFYVRIQPPPGGWRWDAETHEWWLAQNEWARREWEDQTAFRHYPGGAATYFVNWVDALWSQWHAIAGVEGDPIFVANPAGFDWQWVNDLLLVHVGRNPFKYRPLCSRSMAYGFGEIDWASHRTDWDRFYVAPDTPHHALSDAQAQMHTQIKLLEHRAAITRVIHAARNLDLEPEYTTAEYVALRDALGVLDGDA